jgi:hypothetical protein
MPQQNGFGKVKKTVAASPVSNFPALGIIPAPFEPTQVLFRSFPCY